MVYKENLNWEHLRDDRCPKCAGELEKDLNTQTYVCIEDCGFKITIERKNEIVSNMENNEQWPMDDSDRGPRDYIG